MEYYRKGAADFYHRTVSVDMDAIYQRFLPLLHESAIILDAGCGSGRDLKVFSERGFQVSAIDSSPELAKLAEAHSGISVKVCRVQDFSETNAYDGIWACASLLHVPEAEMNQVFLNLWHALKVGGVLYCSFKYGSGERLVDGRHFTDADETRLAQWFGLLEGSEIIETWQSVDQRPDAETCWINSLLKKA
jgi:2-polyprenyl-3-methyl-5-hydroxy-6-metoxy-1,4-benzoquinol methylase